MRRSPIRSKRATPRRRDAPRWTAEEWQAANEILMQRCQGRCEMCGEALTDAVERAHRVRRRDGEDRLCNVVALHPACHALTHAQPSAMRGQGGWILFVTDDPALTPVLLWGETWAILDDDGTWMAA